MPEPQAAQNTNLDDEGQRPEAGAAPVEQMNATAARQNAATTVPAEPLKADEYGVEDGDGHHWVTSRPTIVAL